MIEVEQPAIPSMLAMGFGMSMNNARIPITNTQVPTSHTMVKPIIVETEAPIAEATKPVDIPVQKRKWILIFHNALQKY